MPILDANIFVSLYRCCHTADITTEFIQHIDERATVSIVSNW